MINQLRNGGDTFIFHTLCTTEDVIQLLRHRQGL